MSTDLDVRPSAIAGQWYPGSPTVLRETITRFMDAADPSLPEDEEVVGLIVPHAGYAYSGPVAAFAYRTIRGEALERVVLLGPLHRPVLSGRIGPVMTSGEIAYETPLGIIPIDRDFLNTLAERVHLTVIRADEEHSLEIQLPFLQEAIGSFRLAPLLLAESPEDAESLARCRALGEALAETVRVHPCRTLLVASSDLSHLFDYDQVRRQDRVLVDLVADFDVEGVMHALADGQAYACGGAAVVAVMAAARALEATRAYSLRYATSGDITGDRRPGVYTVGYLAAALTRKKRA
jgi:AmmeMemoRadiSam system protein B